jgi:alkylation response protein AidB-like acyl-CoA dehydrogenase
MDAEERELFGTAIQALAAKGGTLDLDAIGWADALVEDEEAAVSLLFEAQGRANATSEALAVLLGTDVFPLGDRAARFGEGDGLDPVVVEVDEAVDLTEEQLAAGRRALAHELVGSARAMLQLARDHAVDRVQFGVPISSFQAVRHRLADSLVAVETAAAAADGAWLDATPFGAAMAKALAGRQARLVAKHAQQVCAGIGFTTEHDLHRHVRRTYALDHLLGDARTLTRELGTRLLATRQAPPLLPL